MNADVSMVKEKDARHLKPSRLRPETIPLVHRHTFLSRNHAQIAKARTTRISYQYQCSLEIDEQ
jgi:hypothetical protein